MTTYITAASNSGMRSITETEGSAGTGINSLRRVRDVSNEIALLDPNDTAMLTLLMKLRRKPATDVKFEWFEDVFNPTSTTTAEAMSTTELELDFSTAAIANYGRPGDLWQVAATGEVIYVEKVDSTNKRWTVSRGVGDTSGGPITSGGTLYYIGNGHQIGSLARSNLSTQAERIYNYCQLFKESWEVDNTSQACRLYGGKERAVQRYKFGIEHKRAMEKALWFGERDDLTSLDSTTPGVSTTAFLTRGFFRFITSNTTTGTSEYTNSEFDDDLRKAFRYGNSVKFGFGAPMAMSVISNWGIADLQTVPRDTTYGINITRYVSPHGELNLINNKLWYDMSSGSPNPNYSEAMAIVDLEDLRLRVLRGTMLNMNIQETDKDAVQDEYLTECGLELRTEKHHAEIFEFQKA